MIGRLLFLAMCLIAFIATASADCGKKDARCHEGSGTTCCGEFECDWSWQGGKRCVEPRKAVGHSLEGRKNIHERVAEEAKAKADAAKAAKTAGKA